MQIIQHRINTASQLRQVPKHYGVELDLRDRGERLILQHDPFQDGEDFAPYLAEYDHGQMILNVKSERIEFRVLEELAQSGRVRDYFFLDCTVPMIRQLARRGERRIALRYSEFEPIEAALAMADDAQWLWVDCFTCCPLDERVCEQIDGRLKICLVSPELQGHSTDRIAEFVRQLAGLPIDAVCTKQPQLWQAALQLEPTISPLLSVPR